MDDYPKDPIRYTIKCQGCEEAIPITPSHPTSLQHGVIFLVGQEDGYIGITCPDEGCQQTTIVKEDLSTFEATKKQLVQVEMPHLQSSSHPLRHRSFPFFCIPSNPDEGESRAWDFPYSSACNRPLGPEKRIGPFDEWDWGPASREVLKGALTYDPSFRVGLSEGHYCSYSPDDLAIGPSLAPLTYSAEDVEKGVKFENETRLRAFPRYSINSPILESIDTFCHVHLITKLYWEWQLRMVDMAKEQLMESLQELPPDERKELLEELNSAEPSLKIFVSKTYQMQQAVKRNTEFIEILTTSVDGMSKSMELWSPDGDTIFGRDSKPKGIEQEVVIYFNRGLGKDFLENNCVPFMREYIEISKGVDFSLQKVESLKKGFLERLHSEMRKEVLSTEHYAFYEEPPTWTIIFEGKANRGLQGNGFRYLRHMVAYKREEFTLQALGALDGIPNEELPSSDHNPVAKRQDEMPPRKNVERKRQIDPGLAMALKARKNLEEEKAQIEEDLRDADKIDDIGRKDLLSENLEQIEEKLEKAQEIVSAFRNPKKEAHKAADRVGHALKRALEQLMAKNEKAGIHFERALRRKKNPKKPMKRAKYESTISYDPAEDIKWHLG